MTLPGRVSASVGSNAKILARRARVVIILSSLACGLLLVSPRAGLAAPDPWFGPDKRLHLAASAGIAFGGDALGERYLDSELGGLAVGAGLALGAGAAKEGWDALGHGDPSWRDFTWDVIGAAVGLGLAVGVRALFTALFDPTPAETAAPAR